MSVLMLTKRFFLCIPVDFAGETFLSLLVDKIGAGGRCYDVILFTSTFYDTLRNQRQSFLSCTCLIFYRIDLDAEDVMNFVYTYQPDPKTGGLSMFIWGALGLWQVVPVQVPGKLKKSEIVGNCESTESS